MNIYQQYIHLSRYARNGERTWKETVQRAKSFLGIEDATLIEQMEVLPSMRLIASAGAAAERDNSAIYNCSYLTVADIFSFSECMYNLMCRVGVGFSVELPLVECLPKVPANLHELSTHRVIVDDNRIGWCTAYNDLLMCLYNGYVPTVDYSLIRPKGSKLSTFMGLASGPDALREFFTYLVSVFKKATGRRLTSLEVYDIFMNCAKCVEAGGTQNTAMMCLFSSNDSLMLGAKSGNWYTDHPYRRHSNNSAVLLTEKAFPKIWPHIQNGELGFYNRDAAFSKCQHIWSGLNPCGEVILEPFQYCNLTEVVCRPYDTLDSIKTKLVYATNLGIMQSKIDNFRYIRPEWKTNPKLLGVSLTGIYDCPMMSEICTYDLDQLYYTVRNTAPDTFKRVTCIKPSGTVSQLVGCSSGINPYISEYYLRVVRQGVDTKVATQLIKAGVPYEKDFGNPTKYCFYFPQKAVYFRPTSMEHQFETYLKYAGHYTDHNPSITLYVDDWEKAKNLVSNNLHNIVGMAFVEKDISQYQGMQLPVTPCDKDTYDFYESRMPKELFLSDDIEKEQVSECAGGSCKI